MHRRHRQPKIRYVAPKEIDVEILVRNFAGATKLDELEVRQSDGEMKQSAFGLSIISERFTAAQSRPGGGVIYAVPPPGFDVLRNVFIGYIPVVMEHPGIPTSSSSAGLATPAKFRFSSQHAKFLFIFKNQFELGHTEMIFNAEVRTKQMFKQGSEIPKEYKPRVQNIYADYRLCSSGPIVFDSETGLEFAMVVTDQCIYALYSRGTILHEPTYDMAQFCCVKQLWRRTGVDEDFINLSIGIDRPNNRVRYYVDKEAIFEINKLGRRLSQSDTVVDHGGPASIVTPQEVRFGYGHFTFLDHQWVGSNLVHVDKTTDPNSFIYRSESGLCAMQPVQHYKEVLPDMLGRHLPIIPKHTFAAAEDQSAKFQFFEQGMVSHISEMSIVEKQVLYERVSGDQIIDDVTLE